MADDVRLGGTAWKSVPFTELEKVGRSLGVPWQETLSSGVLSG